jgi:hypothetical protein
MGSPDSWHDPMGSPFEIYRDSPQDTASARLRVDIFLPLRG